MATVIGNETMRSIIVERNPRLLVNEADRFGTELAKARLSTSQIRGAFGTVRQIQAGWDQDEAQNNLRKLLLLKPRLAYQSYRERSVRPLGDTLTTGIDLIAETDDLDERKARFLAFTDLFEAILAYHAAAGAK